jgi:hypothetical protein
VTAVSSTLQGIAEMFAASSLGPSVLIPAVIDGRWAVDLKRVPAAHSSNR